MATPQQQSTKEKLIPGVKHIIAVASGKGGVGKSTVSANLALALQKTGAKVGLMDADVYGPSIPTILGVSEKPKALAENRMAPVEKYGLKVISMGFFMPANEAVIWRGPMLHKMVQDFLGIVDWGELDYLLIDLPPGTGDIQLSLCQTIPLTGAVIVSTPQDVAWNVAQKAIVMFDKLNAPVLGIIENMSHYVCGHCGEKDEIFGTGGAKRAADTLEIPFLGAIPLVTALRKTADEGNPIVRSNSDSPVSQEFIRIAKNLATEISVQGQKAGGKPVPAKINLNGAEIVFEWTDGTQTAISSRDLRLACPCAGCVNEFTGQRTLNPQSVPADIHPLAVHTIGRYAVQIVWSDRHNTGLYGYDYVRRLHVHR